MIRRALTVALAAAALLGAPAAADARTIIAPRFHFEPRYPAQTTSLNWSGYDAVRRPGSSYRSVRARWTEPTITCPDVPWNPDAPLIPGDAAFWVGLDGDTTGTVEQLGTEVSCSGDEQQDTAWLEMYPAFPTPLNVDVSAGDQIEASVSFVGNGRYVLKLVDITSGQRVREAWRCRSCRRRSAEAIVEAPYSLLLGVLPLVPFGTLGFTDFTVDGRDASLLANLNQIVMVEPRDRTVPRDAVSDMAPGGSFSVSWLRR